MGSTRVEVVIVGGGPAGLSAALVLGRCRRNAMLFDDGRYRNASAKQLRGFLTRDRTPPQELRQIARRELEHYQGVKLRNDTIAEVRKTERGFRAVTRSGEQIECSAILLATGFSDTQPAVSGVRELHGELVVPCPYCDAWEVRGQPLAAYSHADDRGAKFALTLSNWSNDIVLCADKRPQLGDHLRGKLAERGVRVEARELRSVQRSGDGIELVFSEGAPVWRRMMFYHLGGQPASRLAQQLGAQLDDRHGVEASRKAESTVPGVFVAGDASRDVLQAIVAAGEGAAAAVCINEYLTEKELYAEGA